MKVGPKHWQCLDCGAKTDANISKKDNGELRCDRCGSEHVAMGFMEI